MSEGLSQVKLPELGEGIEGGQVVAILVAPGDSIKKDAAIIEVETDKATMEVPSPISGVIRELLVKEGQQLKVGDAILKLEAIEDSEAESKEEATPPPATTTTEVNPSEPEPPTEAPPAEAEAPLTANSQAAVPVFAAPSVRRLARELGVNIAEVKGTGPGGRISQEDVKDHTRRSMELGLPERRSNSGDRIESMSNVRRTTLKQMTRAWTTIPHVTLNRRADISALEEQRRQLAKAVEGGKLSITAILIKAAAQALERFPKLNASIDLEREAIVYHQDINIGVAVDTPKGLLVPVIPNADRKSILEINSLLGEQAARARAGKLMPNEMRGATFSLSNLGGFGVDYFTPIVNPPQVAILGVGRALVEAVATGEGFEDRLMLPLSLSFDHRLIDGADGARFLSWFSEAMAAPLLMLLG